MRIASSLLSPRLALTAGVAAAMLASVAVFPATAAGPFADFPGSWSGTGKIRVQGQGPERLRCKANYRPRGSSERLAARIIYRGPLMVPVQEGAEVARLVVTRGDVKTLDVPLYAAETVQAGSLQSRALDALFEAATGWVRKALGRS